MNRREAVKLLAAGVPLLSLSPSDEELYAAQLRELLTPPAFDLSPLEPDVPDLLVEAVGEALSHYVVTVEDFGPTSREVTDAFDRVMESFRALRADLQLREADDA